MDCSRFDVGQNKSFRLQAYKSRADSCMPGAFGHIRTHALADMPLAWAMTARSRDHDSATVAGVLVTPPCCHLLNRPGWSRLELLNRGTGVRPPSQIGGPPWVQTPV